MFAWATFKLCLYALLSFSRGGGGTFVESSGDGVRADLEDLGLWSPSYKECPDLGSMVEKLHAVVANDRVARAAMSEFRHALQEFVANEEEHGGANLTFLLEEGQSPYIADVTGGSGSIAVKPEDIVDEKLTHRFAESAAKALNSSGVIALTGLGLPMGAISAARAQAERRFCNIARTLHDANRLQCLVYGVLPYYKLLSKSDRKVIVPAGSKKKFLRELTEDCDSWIQMPEYLIYPPGRFGLMDMQISDEADGPIATVIDRALALAMPILELAYPGVDLQRDVKGVLRNKSPYGGDWHVDGEGHTGVSVNVALQSTNSLNGGTVFRDRRTGEYFSPELPAGSLMIYDYGTLHRAGNFTEPLPSNRWLAYQVMSTMLTPDMYPSGDKHDEF